MASIVGLNLDLSKDGVREAIKESKYLNVVGMINNEVGKFGDSGWISLSQTKEQRDNKEPKTFIGSLKVLWTDGENVAVPPRDDAPALETATVDDDLPF